MPAFGDYQNEIYFKGLHGVKPKLPVNFKLLEQKAQAAMPDRRFILCRRRLRRRATLRTRTSPRSNAGV